jgi:hypothetical protein
VRCAGVPGPEGRAWGPSTIYGNWRRGTGLVNNQLYLGGLVWNRQRFVKDPTTGKRIARLNSEAEGIVHEVPGLRIVDQEVWDRVKARQQETRRAVVRDHAEVRPEIARRPAYLLSGLIKCGVCGGGFSKISQHPYGCSTARNKGTCDNWLTIRRAVLEASVLSDLRTHLMQPDLVKEFVAEFLAEINRLNAAREVATHQQRHELADVERQIGRLQVRV